MKYKFVIIPIYIIIIPEIFKFNFQKTKGVCVIEKSHRIILSLL